MKKSIFFLLCTLFCATVLHAATIEVFPGSGTLKTAVNSASSGDILVLADGEYTESSIKPAVALTIKAADGAKPTLILSSRFEVKADFSLQGITIKTTTDAIRVEKGDALFDVTIDNCLFLLGGETANSARTFMAKETPDQLKNLTIRNSTFDGGTNGTGRFIYLHPGEGIEEPKPIQGTVEIDHCTFYNSTDTRGVYLANIDGCHVTNCIFMNPEERENTNSFAVYGSNSYVKNCLVHNAPVKNSSSATQAACLSRNPYFVDPVNGNFQLYKNSPAINAGTDNSTLGDPRWGVSSEAYDISHDPYIPYKMP